MYEQVEKSKENKSEAVASSVAQKKSNGKNCTGLVDNRMKRMQTPKVNSVSQLKGNLMDYRVYSGPVLQRVPGKKKYTFRNAKLKEGTNTTSKTRKYANSNTTYIPTKYGEEFRYKSDNGHWKTIGIRVRNPKSNDGKNWDAGHIQGNQIGGSGSNTNNIFPQNWIANEQPINGRQYTIKNYSHKRKTGKHMGKHMSWREYEDKKRRKAEKYKTQALKAEFTQF